MEAAARRSELRSKPFYPHIFTSKCSLQSRWSDSRPPVSATRWIPDPHWDSLGYPVALCPGDTATLDQQDRLLHVLPQIMDGVGVRVYQSPPALPILGELSCIALAHSPLAARSKGRGQLYRFHILRVGSSIPTSSETVLLRGPSKVQEHSREFAADEGQGHPSAFMTSGPSLPSAIGCKRWGKGISFPPTPPQCRWETGPDFLCSSSWDQFTILLSIGSGLLCCPGEE